MEIIENDPTYRVVWIDLWQHHGYLDTPWSDEDLKDLGMTVTHDSLTREEAEKIVNSLLKEN